MVSFVTSYRARGYRGGAGAPQSEGERASDDTRHVRRRRPPRMRGFRSDERRLLAAVLVGVALEALAGAVLAADAAVRAGGRLLASLAVLGDRARARHTVGARLRTSVVRVAEAGVALEELLVARVVRGGERHLEADAIANAIIRPRRRRNSVRGVDAHMGSRGDGDVLDHKVGEVLEEALQLLRVLVRRAVRRGGADVSCCDPASSGIPRVAGAEVVRARVPGSAVVVVERQVELVRRGRGQRGSAARSDVDVLDLVVATLRERVVAFRALARRAVGTGVAAVALAATGLLRVPRVVHGVRAVRRLATVARISVEARAKGGRVMEVVDVGACAVAVALVRARSALARRALVAVKALAIAGLARAQSAVRALGVRVGVVVVRGRVDPREAERASARRAVGALPVGVAHAGVVLLARTVARARVGAARGGKAYCGRDNDEAHHDYVYLCPK